jgi:hypothetical protein
LKSENDIFLKIYDYNTLINNKHEHFNSLYRITEADFDFAVKVVNQFDLILITEMMYNATQIHAIDTIFPQKFFKNSNNLKSSNGMTHELKADDSMKTRLKQKLAFDEVYFFICFKIGLYFMIL